MLIVDPSPSSSRSPLSGIPEGDLSAFVGPNASSYLDIWRRLSAPGAWRVSWHWPAALFTGFWLLYRRMYLWFFLYFAASLVFYCPGGLSGSFWFVAATIVMGLFGHWVYFQHAQQKIMASVAVLHNKEDRLAIAAKMGGVDRISPVIYGIVMGVLALISALLVTLFLAFFVDVLLPWLKTWATSFEGAKV